MDLDPTTTKYLIKATMRANGVVEKPDVIGAIFGQTEGLLGDELDLRDLQKSGRIGRIEVDVDSKQGKTEGSITLPSSLDKAETAILAAALESIDRIGPCQANVEIDGIDDVRQSKRAKVADRAKELLQTIGEESSSQGGGASSDLVNEVKEAVRIEELVAYGSERLPAGPNVSSSDAIIVVEGRSDVSNLLTNGIKNAIATEGTSIPSTIKELSSEKVVTAFVDGDRGGELLLKELLQTAEVDFVAQAPASREVEELTHKQIMKSMRNKLPAQQFVEEHGIEDLGEPDDGGQETQQAETTQQEAQQTSKPEKEEKKESHRGKQKPKRDKGQQKQQKQEKKQQETEEREPEPEYEQEVPGEADEGEDEGGDDRGAGPLSDYKAKLQELSGDLEGVLIDADGAVSHGPIPVRDLADKLKGQSGGVDAVVFDGVITQRLLDIAAEKSVRTVVGMKMGNVTKQPADVDVYTLDDL